MALKTELTDEQQYFLTQIDTSSQALHIIINDIIDFSKIETGRLVLESINFELDEIIDRIFNLLCMKIEKKGLELLLSINRYVPHSLVGDPLRLEQILINLTMNAVRFTEKGSIMLNVDLEALKTKQVKLRFSIKDTGIGIPQEALPHLFEAFSQADHSTPRQAGGTGLGLVICQYLVNMMGGEITVESQLGKGSTFSFTAVFRYQEEKTFQLPHELQGLKALVLDDDEIERTTLQEELRTLSFEVSPVHSCEAALENMHETEKSVCYDLIVLDGKMPGLEKIEAAIRIKGARLAPQMPVIIMMLGLSQEYLLAKMSKKLLVDAFITKPVTKYALFNTILWLFGKSQASGQSLKDLRILLAEDNTISQQVGQEMIKSEGLVVEIAKNGKEAVAMLSKSDFDLVFMDIQMPEMDGIEATHLIRKNPRYNQLPIIAITAHDMPGEKEKCLAAGMNDYVTKPINKTQLFSVIEKWISAKDIKPEEESSLPDKLPGINIAGALKRLGGKRRLYHDLLRNFYQDYQDVAKQMKSLLDKGDTETALRLAHTLKRIAGTLGIIDLYLISNTLETALKIGDKIAPQLLKEFEEIINTVMNTIARFEAE